MLKTFSAQYTRIPSGYMGQVVEWPEVITEGKTIEDCRELLQDALQEMIAAYREQKKEIPVGGALNHPDQAAPRSRSHHRQSALQAGETGTEVLKNTGKGLPCSPGCSTRSISSHCCFYRRG